MTEQRKNAVGACSVQVLVETEEETIKEYCNTKAA